MFALTDGCRKRPTPRQRTKNEIGDKIAEGVETPALFRIEILGACNLAVTSVQNIDQLEKGSPGHEPGIVTAHQKHKSHRREREDQHRPSVGSNWQLKEKPRDYA